MTYTPRPLDTSAVALTPDVLALTERLAAHAHDVWALGRLAQGWRYGPARDDVAKTHPSLVPYAELSESEKEFDRQTALGALRALLALGYTITPPAPAG
ncbi:RyR domain-containing protein [Urbifossiella limnaea]|uniref:RyR domain protein n=1 Tax=Urbifossiella limnaea TaxID=2528023 RepID=A0A517XZX4_9BACT|nr:RyR domain-containing protein [Urbifossiella limnaea]QDU23033.1 RyR domain protein [Urbifossiella limnaea]